MDNHTDHRVTAGRGCPLVLCARRVSAVVHTDHRVTAGRGCPLVLCARRVSVVVHTDHRVTAGRGCPRTMRTEGLCGQPHRPSRDCRQRDRGYHTDFVWDQPDLVYNICQIPVLDYESGTPFLLASACSHSQTRFLFMQRECTIQALYAQLYTPAFDCTPPQPPHTPTPPFPSGTVLSASASATPPRA